MLCVLCIAIRMSNLDHIMMNTLGSFDIWANRRMLKISLVQRISNTEVLNRIGQGEGELTKLIKKENLTTWGI